MQSRFGGGMLNAVGLANPGLEEVARHELPWLAARLKRARVLVNVAGAVVDDYVRVVERLTPIPTGVAVEINGSFPNTTPGGLEVGADAHAPPELVRRCRGGTTKPL